MVHRGTVQAASISGRSRTLSGASPPKIQKKSGAKKTAVFSVLLCQNIQFFVAGILGRLGFDSFLNGSTLFFTSENEKNANFEGRSRSRTVFFSRDTEKNMNFDDC